jgi:excisionase family DNA binding protein
MAGITAFGEGEGFVGRAGSSAVIHRMGATAQQTPDVVETNDTSAAAADSLLTAEEVAALLQVTCAWVYAETRRHRIPHLRLGRYVRYRRTALEDWMDEVERSSGRNHVRPRR